MVGVSDCCFLVLVKLNSPVHRSCGQHVAITSQADVSCKMQAGHQWQHHKSYQAWCRLHIITMRSVLESLLQDISQKLCCFISTGSNDSIRGSSWENIESHIYCNDWDIDMGQHKHWHRHVNHLSTGMSEAEQCCFVCRDNSCAILKVSQNELCPVLKLF